MIQLSTRALASAILRSNSALSDFLIFKDSSFWLSAHSLAKQKPVMARVPQIAQAMPIFTEGVEFLNFTHKLGSFDILND